MTARQEQVRALVRKLYKNEQGEPLELSEGQAELFEAVFTREYPRWHVMTTTQYGKSMTAGLAVLTVCSTFPVRFAIIAGKKDKAQIIMDYVIGHIFDNEYTKSRFVIGKNESEESIRRYRNKQRLTFLIDPEKKLYGEVFIGTARDALGFGSPNVIEDEAAFVNDTDHALVMRMLGAAGQDRTFMMKIGNPFERNHFLKSFRDPKYKKLVIDADRAVEEGRLTKEFVAEMRKEAFFDVLYGVKFPDAETIDAKGYSPLLLEADLDRAYIDSLPPLGDLRLGVDVAGGGRNYSTIVLRGENVALLLFRKQTADTMVLVTKVAEYASKYRVPMDDDHVFVDEVGIGRGVADRLNELYGLRPNGSSNHFGVNVGNPPEENESGDHTDKVNLRAQAYWRLRSWVQGGGKLASRPHFDELLDIRYKAQSDKKIKIKPKDDMLADDGIQSPDVADALMLTFTKSKAPYVKPYRQPAYQPSSEYEG